MHPNPVVEMCANEVPTNWLDPLLSGKDAVIGMQPYNGLDIERLLRAIKERIRAIPQAEVGSAATSCVCGNPSSLGIVHRADGPCFHYEAPADAGKAGEVDVASWMGRHGINLPVDAYVELMNAATRLAAPAALPERESKEQLRERFER